MKHKLSIKDILLAVIMITIGVPIVLLIYAGVSQNQQADKLEESINSIRFDSTYRKVNSTCGNEELKQFCSKGYYVVGDISKIETATITNLKQQGYDFKIIPGGYDGPHPAYRANKAEREVVIKFVDSDNQAYKEGMGNVQLKVY